MLSEKTLERLRKVALGEETLVCRTVRYPPSIDRVLDKITHENPLIKKSTILRECIILGWERLNDAPDRGTTEEDVPGT